MLLKNFACILDTKCENSWINTDVLPEVNIYHDRKILNSGTAQNEMIYSQVLSFSPKGKKIKISPEGKKRKRNKRITCFFETNFFLLTSDLCFQFKKKMKYFTFSGNPCCLNFLDSVRREPGRSPDWKTHDLGQSAYFFLASTVMAVRTEEKAPQRVPDT